MSEQGQAEGEPIKLTFGEVEARLARMHEVATDKRTQFQARLRNFQKLGLPAGVAAGRGKTVHYSPGHVVEMALALELTQVGLLPERLISVVKHNKFPIFMAIRMAANALLEKGGFLPDRERSLSGENMPQNTGHYWASHDEADDPMSMFIYFDPSSLYNLMPVFDDGEDTASATFFYGGPGIIRENIVRWTAGPHIRRLALINVTAMIWSLINRTKPDNQRQFLTEVIEWADALEEAHFAESISENLKRSSHVVIESYEDIVQRADLIRSLRGITKQRADAIISIAEQKVREGKGGDRSPDATDELSASATDAMQFSNLAESDPPPQFVVEAMVRRLVAAKEARGEPVSADDVRGMEHAVRLMPILSSPALIPAKRNSKETVLESDQPKPFDLRKWLSTISRDAAAQLKRREEAMTTGGRWADALLTELIDVRQPYVESDDDDGFVILLPRGDRMLVDASIKGPIAADELRAKVNYLASQDVVLTLPRVVFVPAEGILSKAIEDDPLIWDEAFEKNVLLASPGNFAMIMDTVKTVWATHAGSAEGKDELIALVEKKADAMLSQFDQAEQVHGDGH